ncbi:TonB family protein [Geobacter benzoatilyticus]|uniref:TonB family protein n=1 Tax=Geobacter benzoatilyticus TaxID=2815309 RepID=A0ABX7Q6L4_9BACT|nr:TonB family protein [Geobacter benzoatilyticus]QSV46690.1 TonB family protein [Geobacter benzoatilyticus]
MSRTRPPRDTGLGWGFAVSFAIHASLAAFILFFRFSSPAPLETPVYYVDVVNLPVASPQAGSPSTGGTPEPATIAPPPQPAEMALPRKHTMAKAVAPKNSASSRESDANRAFEERMAKLQEAIEERRQEAALDALRRKAAGSGRKPERVGTPGGTGKEAGSDYASYIQSRLTDAFQSTIAHQSKTPEMVVRLTIDAGGRVIRKRIERSSGDRIFDESVFKAIDRAEKTFVPPPGGGEFEYGFIFKPQGVGKK